QKLTFLVPVTQTIGDSIHHSFSFTPLTDDENPANNTGQLDLEVTGSYDPNDKQVNLPRILRPEILADTPTFVYQIRFQNTGNDTAFRVLIRDTIDPHLDLSTFRMLQTSHPYTLELSKDRVFEWTFDNILLPDSGTNEPESHGLIQFQIRALPNLAESDQVRNQAHIYFDFNAPIATNTVTNHFLVVPPSEFDDLPRIPWHVWPNPVSETLYIRGDRRTDETLNVRLYDLTGREFLRHSWQTKTGDPIAAIDMRDLPDGLYMAIIEIGDARKVVRVLKRAE
ncbi:MAG: T9SS type A sorting domain-containing protein, partial [Bacteroidota bacterium]